MPNQQFLKEWKARFNIPFLVVASPMDAGRLFFNSPSIPNVAIIDQNGVLAYKRIGASVHTIFSEIRRLLNRN